jgi:hypothetical protein
MLFHLAAQSILFFVLGLSSIDLSVGVEKYQSPGAYVRVGYANRNRVEDFSDTIRPAVSQVLFTGDGNTIFSCDVEGNLLLWDVSTKTSRRIVGAKDGRGTDLMGIAGNGKYIVLGSTSQGRIVGIDLSGCSVFNLATPDLKSMVRLPLRSIIVYSTEGQTPQENGVEVLSLPFGKRVASSHGYDQGILCIDQVASSSRLVFGSRDGKIRLRDYDTGLESVLTTIDCPVVCIDVASTGKTVAAGCDDGRVIIIEYLSASNVKVLADVKGRVNTVAFSADGTLAFAGGESKEIVMWMLHEGMRKRKFKGSDGQILSLSIDDAKRLIAAGCSDGVVRIWGIDSGKLMASL